MEPQNTTQADPVQGDNITAQIGDNARYVTVGKNIAVTYQLPRPLRTPLDLPERTDHFQDRKEELTQLLTDLQPGKVVTLCGPGGMGKSALAAEAIGTLADQKALLDRFPDGLISHKFYTNRQVAVLLENIARIFDEELKPSPKEAAKRALSGRCLLLLLDGTEMADDLRAILEIRGECGVLITSRSRKDARAIRQDLPPLPPDDAVTLLQAWSGAQAADHEIAYQISQLVGRLPLALRLVGRYLSYSGETATQYLAWLAESPLAALDQGKRQEESVPLLLERSLAQVNERARQVLGVVGLLALSPFEQAVIAASLDIAEGETRQALGELVNYGLLTGKGESYEVTHALIHTYAHERLSQSDEIVVDVGFYFWQEVKSYANDFTHLRVLIPHIMRLLSIASNRKIWGMVNNLAWSIDNYLDLQGYWVDRITSITLNLAATQAMQNRQDEGTLLGNLGNAYRHLGQASRAIDYHQQALAIAKEVGDKSGESRHLGNLGIAYYVLGQIEKAIGYYQQALALDKESGNRNSEDIWLSNLGNAYLDLGQVEQAINYFQKAIIVVKEVGKHNISNIDLGNLGNAYYHLGQFEKATDYYQQALTVAKEVGDRSYEGTWLGNLGNTYNALGQTEYAIDYYKQALVIAREISDHTNEGRWLGNLGSAYYSLRQLDQTINYYQQALVIAKEIGDRRSEEIWLGNLGNVYQVFGQLEQAIDYYQQALTIAKEIGYRSGEKVVLGNLGVMYRKLGQIDQAIHYYQQALAIAKEIGNRSYESKYLGDLGLVYIDLGHIEQSISYFQQALALAQEGNDRKTEDKQLSNLGNAYRKLGKMEQAIVYYQQAFIIAKEIGNHIDEGKHLCNLGLSYATISQPEFAWQCLQQALQIFEEYKSPLADKVRQWLQVLEDQPQPTGDSNGTPATNRNVS